MLLSCEFIFLIWTILVLMEGLMATYQRRFIIPVKNVDEVSDGEHTCLHEHANHQVTSI